MAGAKGSALEWALALLQAPGERYVLRQKPLPADVDVVLGIAAGAMPEALAQAASGFSEPEARIREAAQFYAREVLFFPQANAYRVLGVAANADIEQIKVHHRLLQRWLHPDRSQSEDDAVFAARVNTAWNRLRSPERRREYDQTLRQALPSETPDSSEQLRNMRGWMPADEVPSAPANRWRRRAPVLALLAVCAVLTVLILRDMARSPEQWGEAQPVVAAQEEDGGNLSVPHKPQPTAAARPVARKSALARPAIQLLPAQTARADRPHAAAPAKPVAALPAAILVSDSAQQTIPAVSETSREVAAIPPVLVSVKHDAVTGASPAPMAAPVALPSFVRIQSARQAGEQLLRFMQSPGRVSPPIWNSPRIQSNAEQLRQQLHAGGRVRLAKAQWRIGDDNAELSSVYTIAGTPSMAGQLVANLQWREGYWLVTGIGLEYTQ